MAASAQGKGINQKATETNTVTNTTNTTVVQSKGADAAAIATAIGGALQGMGGGGGGGGGGGNLHGLSNDPTDLIGGTELAQNTPTTSTASSGLGSSFFQQVLIGVAAAVAVSFLMRKAR